MASTNGNKNINVVVIVLCFILLVAFSSSAEVSDSKNSHQTLRVGTGKTRTPANHYYRGCSRLTRCRGPIDRDSDHPPKGL